MEQTEITDLKQIVVELKSDRAAQKEKEKRESWTKWVSLSLVCLAVLTAIATLRGGGYTTATLKQMNEATFNQARASDQWAFYQAKSIKQSLNELELDRAKGATGRVAEVAPLEAKVARYEQEKKEIKASAEKFEADRDTARKAATSAAEHSKDMGLAITVFQISIALGGVCLLVKKRPLWFASMALGLFAAWRMYLVLSTPI